MSHTARDGRRFATAIQRQKYEQWLDTQTRAPGGTAHEEAVRLHGPAKDIRIERVNSGAGTRFEITAKHADGFEYHGAHPEDHVAVDVAQTLVGVNPPLALDTMKGSRNHPTGPKEELRVAKEDGRTVDEEA